MIILLGFFILPGVFQLDGYNFPIAVELTIKITSAIATIAILSAVIIIPLLRFIRGPSQGVKGPALIAATTMLFGLILIFLHALYVKLKICPIDGRSAWYCEVDGKSYVGMIFMVFLLASLAGCFAWSIQRFNIKN